MPRTRSLAWAELKIGIITIASLTLAAILIFALSGAGGFSWERYELKTTFTNIAGLIEGSQVRISGVPVGKVTGIAFVGDRVEVTFEISKEMQSRVTTESRAGLGSVSLLGEAAVDITASTTGTPIPEGGTVPPGPAVGSMTDTLATASKTAESATALIEDIRAGRGTVGKLFTDDTLHTELNAFITAAEQVASNVNRGRGTLGRLATNDATARALEGSLQNLEAVTARIRSGEGSLGKLLNDDALSRSLTSATTNLDTITGRLSKGEGTLGQLMTNDQLFKQLTSMSNRLDGVMASLQQGEGTAGQLLRDKQLYENMNAAVAEMKNLITDIRADPRKYLNVRVSLF
jgi:phospholipid/cholesterol/gamma-HCH transport system substrate-binding protein